MRTQIFLVLILAVALPGFAQTAASAKPDLPTDPREIFAVAAPFYDFSSSELKPWHLKVSYQLYDEKGKHSEPGTYEYWWASPQVYRSTWTRGGAIHSDWHTADGKHLHQDVGEPLAFFEYQLQDALLSPLPSATELDPEKSQLSQEFAKSKGAKFSCIMVAPIMPQYKQLTTMPFGLYPTYCFDSQLPVLRASHAFGTMTTEFNRVAEVANRYLPREIQMYDGSKKILLAQVDSITSLNSLDSAFAPPIDGASITHDKIQIKEVVATGKLLKKQQPVYPNYAKASGIQGTVLLKAYIGRDGGIRNLRVISAPDPSLAISALWAVSQWQYKPYLLEGEPVEVQTTVTVIFSLGG